MCTLRCCSKVGDVAGNKENPDEINDTRGEEGRRQTMGYYFRIYFTLT
jgi:hypothetical protein